MSRFGGDFLTQCVMLAMEGFRVCVGKFRGLYVGYC